MVNGHWRGPAISGRQKAELKTYFKQAGLPWVYEAEHPEVRSKSPYNKRPKGKAHERKFETRIAEIRKNLSTQEGRLEELRQ
mmetsp:Transcript_38852/g.59058  ORF Transcript_38852/g.59058 Transcript_38852/m.59058 type:complete len:82 (-) Transcript_38852:381-626(-)